MRKFQIFCLTCWSSAIQY